ncbi:response regulator transcription factor [Thalassotalea agarivorans]|nr:response regulator transcription factor [Thalassotalea agarivorans]
MADSVLIIEDDNDIANLIAVQLKELSLHCEHRSSGEAGLARALEKDFALVILDVMLPQMSGLDVCRQLRDTKSEQAIMMLTSRDSETDRVLGLELGADDYMTKPFSVREFQARVRSQMRKVAIVQKLKKQKLLASYDVSKAIAIGHLIIDQNTHSVSLAEKPIDLTSTEFLLLSHLAAHPEQVFSREQLLSAVWGYHHSGYEHTVNSHINRLRSKLEQDAGDPKIVQTVWGVGYKFNPAGVCH